MLKHDGTDIVKLPLINSSAYNYYTKEMLASEPGFDEVLIHVWQGPSLPRLGACQRYLW